MALKVIGVGFGRTGTESLYRALNELGLPCYHMYEVIQNKANASHLDFWLNVARAPAGTHHDWEQVFARYTAAVDNPACVVWRELLAEYPGAKLILTLHPKGPEAWYESTMDTIYFSESTWQFKVLKLVTPFGRKFGEMVHTLVWQRGHAGTITDRAQAIAYYEQHIEKMKAAVPPEQLLVFKVSEGWAPLCQFLGLPVPSTPFPNVNSRAEFQKVKAGMFKGAYAILGIAAAAFAGLAYAAATLLG